MALIHRLSRSEGAVRPSDFSIREADWFAHVDLEEALPVGAVVVPLGRLLNDASLVGREELGVRVGSDTRLEALLPFTQRLARIEIEFPKFTDGRGYTLGRRLRAQGAFVGELCAVGEVLRDQALYLHRSGFDVLQVPVDKDPSSLLRAFEEMTVFYQAAHDQRLPLYKRVAR